MNSFLCIRVRLNINEPLIRKKRIHSKGDNYFEVSFNYKNKLLVCYICGIIGHNESYCWKLLEASYGAVVCGWPKEIRSKVQQQTRWLVSQWWRDYGGLEEQILWDQLKEFKIWDEIKGIRKFKIVSNIFLNHLCITNYY